MVSLLLILVLRSASVTIPPLFTFQSENAKNRLAKIFQWHPGIDGSGETGLADSKGHRTLTPTERNSTVFTHKSLPSSNTSISCERCSGSL